MTVFPVLIVINHTGKQSLKYTASLGGGSFVTRSDSCSARALIICHERKLAIAQTVRSMAEASTSLPTDSLLNVSKTPPPKLCSCT